MYSDYLDKKRKEKNIPTSDSNMESMPNGDHSANPDEETKQQRGNLKTGDKYIIRKLVSMKIMPEQIQDFISLVAQGTAGNTMNMNWYQMGYSNMAPNYNENILQAPQYNSHMRSNSWYAVDQQMNLVWNQPMGFVDDSQLIQSFAQFSLMNQNPYYNQQSMMDVYQMQPQNNGDDISLENNFSNYEGQLSSIPSHMKNPRLQRSHSINRIPESSTYIKDSFLFDKLSEQDTDKSWKDDNAIKTVQNPIIVEDNQPMPVKNFKWINNIQADDNLSNSSRSSKSSIFSFNESASCSSLEMSFDGSGTPYIKPFRTSAFAKVKNATDGDQSNSQESSEQSRSQEREKPVQMDDGSYDPDKHKGKSSFFRLKHNKDPT